MINLQTQIKNIQTFLKDSFKDNLAVDVRTRSLSIAKQNAYFHEHAVADLLPYEVYDPETQIYHNQNNLGILIEACPLIGLDDEAVLMLTAFLQEKLPQGAILQILLIASPDIEGLSNALQANRAKRGGIFETLAKKRCEFLKQGTQKTVLKSEDFLIRDFKLIFSLSMDKNDEVVLLKLKKEWLLLLRSLKLAHQLLLPDGFIRLTQKLINPYTKSHHSLPYYDENNLLAAQVAPTDTSLSLTSNELSINEGECLARVYRATEYPQQWVALAMNDLIGDPLRANLRLGNPFVLSMVIYASNSEIEKTRLQTLNLRSSQKAASKLSNLIPNLKAIDQDLKKVVHALDEGDKLLKVSFHACVYGDMNTIDKGSAQLESLLSTKKFKFSPCRYTQLPAFLSLLPMIVHAGWIDAVQRFGWFKTQLASTLVHFMPLTAESKGMGSASIPILGRRGQLAFYDAFVNAQGNYNAITVGVSGSGKSNFNQEKILARVGSGGRAYIIDVGGSYEKDALLLEDIGAQYIQFTPDAKISLNPFTQIDPNEMRQSPDTYLSLLKPLIAQMASPSRPLPDLQLSFLEQAILAIWSKFEQNSTITHIAEYLNAHNDPRARDLGQMLLPYTDKGAYGHYFKGPCTLNFSSPLICFELEGLKSKKDLQSVVLMLLIYQITQAMYLGDRKTQITCLIDEADGLLKGAQGAEFIGVGCRRARKYNGSINLSTHSVDDLFQNPVAEAAFDNSDFLEILRQKPSNVQKLIQSGRLPLNPLQQQMLKTLVTQLGEYAEIIIIGPEFFLIGKLIWDPFHGELYSSTAADVVAIKERMIQGLSLEAAIEERVRKKHDTKLLV
ncbi:MAG: type IV secretion system protein TraC [Legionellales bacterium]